MIRIKRSTLLVLCVFGVCYGLICVTHAAATAPTPWWIWAAGVIILFYSIVCGLVAVCAPRED